MSIVRVHYRERQRLSAADMRLEQDYRLGLGGRHNLAHHSWGIVRGLRLVVNAGGGYWLTPGIAIDGYGREIAVPRALAVDAGSLDANELGYVQLFYCEESQQPAAGKSCGKQPAPRIGPRPIVVATGSFAPPVLSPDNFAGARAAGGAGLAPWPVLVATVSANMAIDYSLTRYAAHRASSIRAPNARALMQLGLASRVDFYHFLLSTRDATSTLAARIGIDRHGTVHFWRQLCITASKVEARIRVANKLLLRIALPKLTGPGRATVIEGEIDAKFKTLMASLLAREAAFGESDTRAHLMGESATLEFPDGALGKVELFDLKHHKFIKFSEGRPRVNKQLDGQAAKFSERLVALDATLVLKNVPHRPIDDASPCDVARTRGADTESDLSGLLFRPTKQIDPDPLSREFHAVDTSKPTDLVSSLELRIAGGAADDSDAATRISIGTRAGGNYQSAFRMDGGRRMAIRALTGQEKGPVLAVKRTVHLPPIGAKDPLLPELLMLAYIGGLRRIGNVTSDVTVELSPPETAPGVSLLGMPPSYQIVIRPSPGPYKIKRAMELVTGKNGKGDLTFRTLDLTSPPISVVTEHGNITMPHLGRAGSEIEVVVLLLVEVGQKARVAVSKPLVIKLDNPTP